MKNIVVLVGGLVVILLVMYAIVGEKRFYRMMLGDDCLVTEDCAAR